VCRAKHTSAQIPKPAARNDDRVNRIPAFSGAGEKSAGKGRKRAHGGNRTGSPTPGAENRIVWKWLALLGIPRETGEGARKALPSTMGAELSEKMNLAPQVGFEPTTLRLAVSRCTRHSDVTAPGNSENRCPPPTTHTLPLAGRVSAGKRARAIIPGISRVLQN
jgi:hypothetical protein